MARPQTTDTVQNSLPVGHAIDPDLRGFQDALGRGSAQRAAVFLAALAETCADVVARAHPAELAAVLRRGQQALHGIVRVFGRPLDDEPFYLAGRFAGLIDSVGVAKDRNLWDPIDEELRNHKVRELVGAMKRGGMRGEEIRERLAISPAHASRRLRQLVRRGVLIRHQVGREAVWEPTEAVSRRISEWELGHVPEPAVPEANAGETGEERVVLFDDATMDSLHHLQSVGRSASDVPVPLNADDLGPSAR